ncbi:MAG: hypothetical protein ACTSYE_02200 [Alphaproteobacteria bacterium]
MVSAAAIAPAALAGQSGFDPARYVEVPAACGHRVLAQVQNGIHIGTYEMYPPLPPSEQLRAECDAVKLLCHVDPDGDREIGEYRISVGLTYST